MEGVPRWDGRIGRIYLLKCAIECGKLVRLEKVTPTPASAGFSFMGQIQLSTADVAERLHVSLKCLDNWRRRGTGPPFHKVGRRVYYLSKELRHWSEVCEEPFASDGYSGDPRTYGQRLTDGFMLMYASEYD